MRNKILPATMAAVCGLLLCSMGDHPQRSAELVPPCGCVASCASWSVDGFCGPPTNLNCSQQNLVSDTLSCTRGDTVCGITGSVEVTYDPCTTLVCVEEFHTSCSASCPGATGESDLADGEGALPQQDACCLGPAGCTYNFEARFYNGPTSCPNMMGQNAHCIWSHQFQCL